MEKIYTLKNQFISAKFNTFGAEMISLKNQEGTEYLWQADKLWWGRRAPILFPRVGNEGESSVRKHGFARDVYHQIISITDTKISFSLSQEDIYSELAQSYPYNFELITTYELINNSIKTTFEITSEGPYQIGGHPAFYKDHDQTTIVHNGSHFYKMVAGKIDFENRFETNGLLTIDSETFKNDALFFKGSEFSLNNRLHLISNCDIMGVWAPPGDCPFVCIEPWWVDTKKINSFSYTITIL